MKKKIVLEYTLYRKNFNFEYKQLNYENNCIYFDDEIVENDEKKFAEGENFLNVGYGFKNSNARVLSNLYPMQFKFRGKKVNSIEGVLQSLKYKDKKLQNIIHKYSGLDAYHTRAANTIDFWGNNGILYWQGREMLRNSEEYQIFLDELYLSALKNPLYKKCLNSTGNKYLLHHIGNENIKETVLTRFEYEQRLNSLREYSKLKKQ